MKEAKVKEWLCLPTKDYLTYFKKVFNRKKNKTIEDCMNYKRVAKCLGGLSFWGLSAVCALANLHLPEDIKEPFINDAYKTITLANRDMMELSIQALQLKNDGLGGKAGVGYCVL